MKRWNLKEMIGNAGTIQDDRRDAIRAAPPQQSCIEESFAYAAYCASRVEGVERIGFEEFLRQWPRD
ncbi:MAG: hypothetical protein ACR2FI_03780 [Burkholderiales bacterium]|nr:hypothetical protein [Pseudomonadota bacterium]